MTAQVAERVGNQTPRIQVAPEGTWEDADDCAYVSTSYGLQPDPWQYNVLSAWMRRGPDGRWAAGRWGLAVPRQNGKNGVLEMVELYFTTVLGLRILHTAHEVKTARKAFIRLVSFFENDREFPELASMVKEIRKTNGQEAIVLTNGGSIEFVARSRGSGRGFTVDVLVCDEAQEYGEEAQAALLPTISSAPSGDPVQILTGTPPSELMDGEVWVRMRSQATGAEPARRLAWLEWSAAGDVDVTDQDLWFENNPSLGYRLNPVTVEDECGAMTPEQFARERLGMWYSDSDLSVIPSTAWEEQCVVSAPPGDVAAYGIDMNPERTLVRLCVAVPDEGGHFLELAELGDAEWSTDKLVEWVASRAGKRTPVVLDAFSPVSSIEPKLRARGVKTWKLSGGELLQACGGFYDGVVRDRNVWHSGQVQMASAIAGAKKKKIGDSGGFKWIRKDMSVDLTPLIAATCALYGATKSKGRAKRGGDGKVIIL